MKFICMGYIDEEAWAAKPESELNATVEQCLAYDETLRENGHYAGGEALQSIKNCVTLRARGDQVDVTDGPFVETKEHIGGILLLEARDMNHAIQLMSKHPGVRVGPFEIRPADEEFNAMIAARLQAAGK